MYTISAYQSGNELFETIYLNGKVQQQTHISISPSFQLGSGVAIFVENHSELNFDYAFLNPTENNETNNYYMPTYKIGLLNN